VRIFIFPVVIILFRRLISILFQIDSKVVLPKRTFHCQKLLLRK